MDKRILIVVAAGATSRAAVVEGVALAKVDDAEALFFSVLPRYIIPMPDMPPIGIPSLAELQRQATSEAECYQAAAKVVANKAGVRSKHAVEAGPDDAQCIVRAARKRRCDLIVVASLGRNAITRLLVGCVIPGLITHSTIPLLVVRQPSPGEKAKRLALAPRRPRLSPRKAGAAVRARRRLAAHSGAHLSA